MTDELEVRIAARLTEALRQQAAAGFEVGEDAGLALAGVVRLSVADVARLAAQVARGPDTRHGALQPGE